MITFDLDQDAGRVRLDPTAVSSITETEREGRGGTRLIAEITLHSGARYVVCDPERTVSESIITGASAQRRERLETSNRIARALETLGLSAVEVA